MIYNDKKDLSTIYIDDNDNNELKELNDDQFVYMIEANKIKINDKDASRNQISNRIDIFLDMIVNRFPNEKDDNEISIPNKYKVKILNSDSEIMKQVSNYSLIYNNYEYSTLLLDNLSDSIDASFIVKLISSAYEFNKENNLIEEEDFIHNIDCSLFIAMNIKGLAQNVKKEYTTIVDNLDKDDEEKDFIKKAIKVILDVNNFE